MTEQTPEQQADTMLASLRSIGRKLFREAEKLAKTTDYVVVNRQRYEQLELLADELGKAIASCQMTRDYRDVIGKPVPGTDGKEVEHYVGKRWLIQRELGNAVARAFNTLQVLCPKRAAGPK